MTWLLAIGGILLLLLGLWGGPAASDAHEPAPVPPAVQQAPSAAWEVLARPIIHQDELIRIPKHRPWYLPGKDRRFLQGLLVGLGSGLMVTALALTLFPRTADLPPQVAAGDPNGVTAPQTDAPQVTAPPPAAGDEEPSPEPPAATEPAPPANEPEQPPVLPANITFVVEEGELAPDIAAKLKAAGLIADEQAFLDRVTELGVDTSLKAGTFVIPTQAELDVVIEVLTA